MSYSASDRSMLARAAEYAQFRELAALNREVLAQVAREEGIDFATALLYDRIKRSAAHASIITAVEQPLGPSEPQAYRKPLVAIVPAAFYREKPHSGADGQVVRQAAEKLGFDAELIPTRSTGTLLENAVLISEWMLRRDDGEPIILVSLCKGGADVKTALNNAKLAGAFHRVKAWVNVCGTLNGSPFAEWMLATKARFLTSWLFFKCSGHDFKFLREIVPSRINCLSSRLQVPAGMRFVSVVGFPLRNHLSNRFMRRCHAAIAEKGPNDGGILLADVCSQPGELYPVWGADHYLRPTERAEKILSEILRYVAADCFSPRAPDNVTVPGAQ